ncbi:phage Gp37/Gp68 family protein [Candidatus Gracilibacteria bacterium]|nr:phage Gp37/Gp68 family protein [Candidatus Gracilibacteria bacterium]
MGMTTIEWTSYRRPDGTVVPGYSFNPWRGCTKVSAGCRHCYAESLSGRNPAVLGVWGPRGSRPIAAESYWRQPLAWNAEAGRMGERRRVFCASLADVFEGPESMPVDAHDAVENARWRLYQLIVETPHLDWLLLTKRPQHILAMLPERWAQQEMPPNVWIGVSIEDQSTANARIPYLRQVPARVRFVSCEPLLGPVNLHEAGAIEDVGPTWADANSLIDWVIVGGESGSQARPMHPHWARSLRDQCVRANIPFFFKQWGSWAPDCLCATKRPCATMERPQPGGAGVMFHCGKKAAGRMLDSQLWDDLPLGGGVSPRRALMELREGQWYQLPSRQWVRASCVDAPATNSFRGPILEVYGVDVTGSDGYKAIGALYIYHDGTLTATGTYTWETWTVADLCEATPDEAEAQTRRVVGLP